MRKLKLHKINFHLDRGFGIFKYITKERAKIVFGVVIYMTYLMYIALRVR